MSAKEWGFAVASAVAAAACADHGLGRTRVAPSFAEDVWSDGVRRRGAEQSRRRRSGGFCGRVGSYGNND